AARRIARLRAVLSASRRDGEHLHARAHDLTSICEGGRHADLPRFQANAPGRLAPGGVSFSAFAKGVHGFGGLPPDELALRKRRQCAIDETTFRSGPGSKRPAGAPGFAGAYAEERTPSLAPEKVAQRSSTRFAALRRFESCPFRKLAHWVEQRSH